MTATAEHEVLLLRDLGEHGRVEYVETPRRAYHLITPDGKRTRLPSVTTVLGIVAKPAIVRWSEAQGAAGAFKAVQLGELDPKVHQPEEAIDIVRALGLGADAAKTKAADRGLDVHGALDLYCETGELPHAGDMSEDAAPYLQGLAKWLVKYKPVPIHQERVVCHPGLGYCGRFDLLCEIGGHTALVDLKTSKSGVPYAEAHWQMAAYVAAEVAVGEPRPMQVLAVGIGPEGVFNNVPCCAADDAFEQVLAVYRQKAEIEKLSRRLVKDQVSA
jgi:hypothetical protein